MPAVWRLQPPEWTQGSDRSVGWLRSTARLRDGVGLNYLAVCRASKEAGHEEAAQCLTGLEALLAGEIDAFDMEYVCHAPTEQRYFLLRRLLGRSASDTCLQSRASRPGGMLFPPGCCAVFQGIQYAVG